MARYDKYDPVSGGFRARLAASVAAGEVGKIVGYGLDSNGRAVVGDGATGVLGVVIVNEVKNAGDIVDCMTAGEIVDLPGTMGVGDRFYAAADGSLNTTSTNTPVGHTTDDGRLVVRVTPKAV